MNTCPKCASSYGPKDTRLIGGVAWTRCPRCLEMFEAAATSELDERDPTLVVQQFEESFSVPAKIVGPSHDDKKARKSQPPATEPLRFSSPPAARPSRPDGLPVRASRPTIPPGRPAAPAIRRRASSIPPPLPNLPNNVINLRRLGYYPAARSEEALVPDAKLKEELVPESCVRKVVVVPSEPIKVLATIARQAPVIVGADEVAAAAPPSTPPPAESVESVEPVSSASSTSLTRWSRWRLGVLSFLWTMAIGGTVSAPMLVTAQTARAAANRRPATTTVAPPAPRAASALVNGNDRSDVIELDDAR